MIQEKETYNISQEVFKFPYNGNFETNDDEMFSEKFCCYIVKIGKKGIKWTTFYLEISFTLTNGVIPSQAIGLPIFPTTAPIMRSMNFNDNLSAKPKIAPVINNRLDKIIYTEYTNEQIADLYKIAGKFMNGRISSEEAILKLRAGKIDEWVASFGIIIAVIITALNSQNVDGFQVPPAPRTILPPHLATLYGNQRPHHPFGYEKNAGPRSVTVTGATQNAGSERKQPSNGSWDYAETMRELNSQISKKRVEIQVGDQMYTIKNPNGYSGSVHELAYKLAEQISDSIRECDTDISDIAANLGVKENNIKNVKDHVFYNEHYLDRYAAVEPFQPVERRRFDANLQQILAWKRLENGIHTQDDITWIKHECSERHYELKYNSGYSAAHNRAQRRFDGAPWENNFNI